MFRQLFNNAKGVQTCAPFEMTAGPGASPPSLSNSFRRQCVTVRETAMRHGMWLLSLDPRPFVFTVLSV